MSTPSQFTSVPPAAPPEPPPGSPRWIPILFVIVFIFLGYLVYSNYSDRQMLQKNFDSAAAKVQNLSTALDKTNSQLADLKGEVNVTTQKLGLTQDELARARGLAQQARKEQQASSTKLNSQINQVQSDTASKFGEVNTQITGTQNDVNQTKADLASTKERLQSTVGDLGVQSGLIAKNHEEVEELKRLGERNIFEFKLTKSKEMQRIGPIQVSLQKVDVKRYKYTLEVLADDKKIEKRDKTANEPVQFYVRGERAPYEIVVFDVTKNTISGYLSTPKEKGAPASAPSGSSNAPSSSGSPNSATTATPTSSSTPQNH
jgi:hypothetical protein